MAFSFPSRQSTADIIFRQLREEILTLDILPGSKLSEAEVAQKFGVSRQPVREALNLLSNEELVDIQPQKATRVGLFSLERIKAARFTRRAVEMEIIQIACDNWSEVFRPGIERSLAAQERATQTRDTKAFHALDEEFHGLLTEVAAVPFAFEQIKLQKSYIDRICVLSLKNAEEMLLLVEDHRAVFEQISKRNVAGAQEVMRRHLSRIETTIERVRQSNPDYFDS